MLLFEIEDYMYDLVNIVSILCAMTAKSLQCNGRGFRCVSSPQKLSLNNRFSSWQFGLTSVTLAGDLRLKTDEDVMNQRNV